MVFGEIQRKNTGRKIRKNLKKKRGRKSEKEKIRKKRRFGPKIRGQNLKMFCFRKFPLKNTDLRPAGTVIAVPTTNHSNL